MGGDKDQADDKGKAASPTPFRYPEVLAIADAKKNFSSIVRESSEALKLYMVGNALRREAPRSVILGEQALRVLLRGVQGHPVWEEDAEHHLWSVEVPEFEAVGQGETKEEAVKDLLWAVVELAEDYIEDIAFYFKIGWQDKLPFALAAFLAADDPERLRRLLGV